MKKLLSIFLCIFFYAIGFSQINIIRNGDFSIPNSDWVTSGNFNYNNCKELPCSPSSTYAYTAAINCDDIDDASGTLSQTTNIIPNNATGGYLIFDNRTGTTNTTSPVDYLAVSLIINGVSTTIYELSNLNYSPNNCSTIPQIDISPYLIANKGQSITLQFSAAEITDGTITVFRISNVQLEVTTSGSPGCVNWINGNPPQDPNVLSAADYLCQHEIIASTVDVSTLPTYPLENASLFTLASLFNGLSSIPSLPSDYYPSMITDIAESHYPQAIQAMLFLEYGDGVSCINRNFYSIHPTNAISLGNILRMVLEAYNIPPDTNGQDPFSHTPSLFFSNIYTDDFNYGYFQKAYEIGLLNGYFSGNIFQSQITPGEFFLLILQRVYSQYQNQHPPIDSTAFYLPNDLSPNNASGINGTAKAVFSTYEKDGFKIPSSGLGLQFNYSYHSDLTEMPLLNQEIQSGSVAMESVKQRLYPLGVGWTYSYNIYIQPISDNQGNDAYLAIKWGDGSMDMFDVNNNVYLTQGVFNSVAISQITNGKVQNLSIKTKDQYIYIFKRDGGLLTLQSITDRSNNSLSFTYEASVCGQNGYGESGSYNRLSKVTDYYGGRYLQFSYYPGTDVLYTVSDNIGRAITFHVDRQNLNLSLEINQKNLTTTYLYYYGNGSQNLLQSIIKPRGNSITASYIQRKLQSVTTPDYSAAVSFGTSYTSSSPFVQTTLQVSPATGNTYTTSYNYGSFYNILQSTSKTSNLVIEYTDPNHPTLPTRISELHQDLAEVFEYGTYDNVIRHSIQGQNGDDEEEYFTYDEANNVKTHTLQNGSVTTYNYDNNYNLINESGPLGYNKTYTRDGLERVIAVSDGTKTTRIGYNDYGNVNNISIDGTSILQSAQYDDVSRLTDETDANGHSIHYGYDLDDNDTIKIEDLGGLNLTTKYVFDPNDNISSIIDPKGNNTSLQYNNSDDIAEELSSNNIFRTWSYNDDGTLKQYQNKKGIAYNYQYYPQGDANEGKIETDGYRTYDYYSSNNVLDYISSSDGLTEDQYSYDDFLRIKYQNFSAPNFSSSVGYLYDNSNNVTQISLNPGVNFNYVYDSLNRISEVKDWNNSSLVKYTYTANGLLQNEVLGNGVQVNYHYDAAERIDSIWSLKTDGTLLHAIGCTMDNSGNHIRESYFVKWNGSTYNSSVFEPPTYQYDANNHMIDANGTVVTNDNDGNVNTNLQSNFSFGVYNQDDNLLSCIVDGKNKSFMYDPSGVRYGDDNSIFTLDILHNNNVLAVQQQGSSLYQQVYVHSPYGLVCSIDPTTNAKTYYLYDFRGSTVALVDDNQNAKQYYKYDPFGEITESSDSLKIATPFLFVGKYGVMYESPHLYYMRARYYDPTIGRFLGEDKNWNINLFTYGDNNPLSNIDPKGKSWMSIYQDALTVSGLGISAGAAAITKLKDGVNSLQELFDIQFDELTDYLNEVEGNFDNAGLLVDGLSLINDGVEYHSGKIGINKLVYDASKIGLQETVSRLIDSPTGFLVGLNIMIWENVYYQWKQLYDNSQ